MKCSISPQCIGVSTDEGHSALARMFSGPCWIAVDFVRPMTACGLAALAA